MGNLDAEAFMMRRTLVTLPAVLGLLAGSVVAQNADHAAEAQQRLDYLIGSWDVISDVLDPNGNVMRTRRSFDVTEPLIGNKVLLTTSHAADGTIRKSLRFYDEQENTFYQIDVGAAGDVYVLTGGMEEYVMTTQPRSTRRGTIMYRFQHTNIQPNSFEATMETSRDGGETWTRSNTFQRLERRRPNR
jgi:hypothetical protein